MKPIVTDAYPARGGHDPNLPDSAATTSGRGRADIRIQVDADGELYLLSKSDGMIRAVFAPRTCVPGDYNNNNGQVEQGDLDLVLTRCYSLGWSPRLHFWTSVAAGSYNCAMHPTIHAVFDSLAGERLLQTL